MSKEIRLLKHNEIEVRVQQVNSKGYMLLLYKDARVDMKILDELYGPTGWQRTHQLIGDRLYCTIEIWDSEKGCWVAKQDVGTESNTEKEKGQASDSFKRAGTNVGIGRELYTAPSIWVWDKNDIEEFTQNGKTKYKLNYKISFNVKEISYNEENREITHLVIVDNNGKIKFQFKNDAETNNKQGLKKTNTNNHGNSNTSGQIPSSKKASKHQQDQLQGLQQQAPLIFKKLLDQLNIKNTNILTSEQAEWLISKLTELILQQ